jgi:hypothetical protein
MRNRGAVAVCASAVAHAAMVLALWEKSPVARVEELPPAPIEIVEVTPIEVVTIPVPVTDVGVDGARAPASRAHAAASASTSGPGTAPETESPSTSTSTSTSASTSTSKPTKPTKPTKIVVPIDTIAKIIDRDDLPPPYVPPDSGLLDPSGGGTKIARDAVTNLKVDADGTAHFDDKSDNSIALTVPGRRALGTMIEDWYKDPEAQLESPPVAELPAHEQAVPGGWDSGVRRGSVAAETAENGIVPIVQGGFDLTSWAMRQAGMDPYYARKQRLLEDTFDERAAQRATHKAEQYAQTEQIMRGNLQRLWRQVADPAERRRALFELWDECEEGEGPAAEAGDRARRQVVGWIRAKLPAGSTEAYSAEELAALNAGRKSTRKFDPY